MVITAALSCGQAVRAQTSVPSTVDAAKSAIETHFMSECSKHFGRMKLFPGDTFDVGGLCSCSFKKIEGNARMMEFLPKMQMINMKIGSPPEEYRYHAAKLFSAVTACKGAQLDQLADSGALDAPGAIAIGAGDEGRLETKTTSRPTAPTYDRNSVECRPKMPAVAIQTRATGVTRLEFLVEKTGHVSKFWILRSSGDTLAHKVLDLQAAAAMSACPFGPALRDGNPVDQVVSQEFRWVIE